MTLITTVLAFLLALGPLIIFHELGHYTVARLCGVKVLRFSVGMGKVVWSRRFGPDQTEWAVSMLPLGGYVKMLDARDPDAPAMDEADLQREFTRQNVWRRIAIVAAGPLANFLLAIVLFAGLAMAGTVEPSTRLRAHRRKIGGLPGRPARRRKGRRGQRQGGRQLDRTALGNHAGDRRQARRPPRRDAAAGRPVRRDPAGAALAGLDVEGDVLAALGLDMARPKPVIEQVIAGGPARTRRPAGRRPGHRDRRQAGASTASPLIEAVRAAERARAGAVGAARRRAGHAERHARIRRRPQGLGDQGRHQLDARAGDRRLRPVRGGREGRRQDLGHQRAERENDRPHDHRRSLAGKTSPARSPSPTTPARPRAWARRCIWASSPSSASVLA